MPSKFTRVHGDIFRCHNRAATKKAPMNLHLGLTPIISLLAGILILVVPRMLNYIVAIYLILIGLVGILGAGQMHLG
jgi:hypothetical protein